MRNGEWSGSTAEMIFDSTIDCIIPYIPYLTLFYLTLLDWPLWLLESNTYAKIIGPKKNERRKVKEKMESKARRMVHFMQGRQGMVVFRCGERLTSTMQGGHFFLFQVFTLNGCYFRFSKAPK